MKGAEAPSEVLDETSERNTRDKVGAPASVLTLREGRHDFRDKV
jgi:hypothetical protein